MRTLHRVNGSDFASNWKFTLCRIISHIENRKRKLKKEMKFHVGHYTLARDSTSLYINVLYQNNVDVTN